MSEMEGTRFAFFPGTSKPCRNRAQLGAGEGGCRGHPQGTPRQLPPRGQGTTAGPGRPASPPTPRDAGVSDERGNAEDVGERGARQEQRGGGEWPGEHPGARGAQTAGASAVGVGRGRGGGKDRQREHAGGWEFRLREQSGGGRRGFLR